MRVSILTALHSINVQEMFSGFLFEYKSAIDYISLIFSTFFTDYLRKKYSSM